MKRGLLAAALLVACAPATPTVVSDSDLGLELTRPAATQANSALLGKASAYAAPQTLRIRRKSLDKPLLYIAAVMQSSDPDSRYYPFQPRLVAFAQEGDTIVLSDIRPSQRYTESATLPRIIAQFPIVKEDCDTVEFNFAEGMKNTFTLAFRATTSIMAETPPHSYITQLAATADTLSLDHHFTETDDGRTKTIVIRHIFKRDTPSIFQPREADATVSFGFFVTPPWYEGHTDTPHRYINHWDIGHPITVALSPGVPALIHPAIQDAVTHWNTALGKEVLILSPAPADRGPLDLRLDISINWVTDDSDSSAYGYMLAHPVTGQVLHGDVMLTSARLTAVSAFSWKTVTQYKPKPITPTGFDSAEVCNDAGSNGPHDNLPHLTSADLQKTLTHRMFQHLITHELGHVLGLRHNFAASIEGQITSKQEREFLTQLAAGQSIADAPLASSSVMDYLPSLDRLFAIQPGGYDVAAIQWAYLSPIGSTPKSSHRYCTDEDTNDMENNPNAGTAADCQRFDSGPDPLMDVIEKLKWNILGYLHQLVALTERPEPELAYIPLAELPSVAAITEALYRLHSYVQGRMVVWTLDDFSSIERIAAAGSLLRKFQSIAVEDIPLIASTRNNLAALINHGDKAEQLRAIDANVRLTRGIQNLEKLLDAPVGSLNKKMDGTAANSDHGS